jgi:hypothetical protein
VALIDVLFYSAQARAKATIDLPYGDGIATDTQASFESGWLKLYQFSFPSDQSYYKVMFKLNAAAKVIRVFCETHYKLNCNSLM